MRSRNTLLILGALLVTMLSPFTTQAHQSGSGWSADRRSSGEMRRHSGNSSPFSMRDYRRHDRFDRRFDRGYNAYQRGYIDGRNDAGRGVRPYWQNRYPNSWQQWQAPSYWFYR